MIYFFTFIAFLSAIGFSKFKEKKPIIILIKYFLIICLSILLFYHSKDWWIYNAVLNTQAEKTLEPLVKFYNYEDSFYKSIVINSYLISVFFILCLIISLFYFKKKIN